MTTDKEYPQLSPPLIRFFHRGHLHSSPFQSSSRQERSEENGLVFSRHSGVREAALLLVRDKNGRYSLLREPLYLDRCVIAADPAWQSYFEVQELMGKDTFIFKVSFKF